jgi:AraC-like DNA-binding protein
MSDKTQLIETARNLLQPDDYFSGLDWGGEILPREIVSFCRMAQDHRTSGWDGISAKAGRYDQHSRYVLLISLEGDGSMGVETNTRQIHEGEAHLLFPHQIHYYIDLPEKFTWLYVTFDLELPALSTVMGVSESYLRAVFRDGAGVSLGNFVRSVRLVRATYLLEQGVLDLGVIAERTGFGSLTSFTRAFRRMYEMTPSSYRKRSRVEA